MPPVTALCGMPRIQSEWERTVELTTLKKRAEFLRIRGGLRWSTPALVVEAKPRRREIAGPTRETHGSRFGFTVSKKVGKAVVRNRVRRRLKAAARELLSTTRPEFDYVVIARPPASERLYADLKADLALALARVHRAADAGRDR